MTQQAELEKHYQQARAADRYFREIFDQYMEQLRPSDNFTWELTELPTSAYRFVAYDRGILFFGTQRGERIALADFAGRVWLLAPYLPQLWGRLLQQRDVQRRAMHAQYEQLEELARSFLWDPPGPDDTSPDDPQHKPTTDGI